MAEDRESLLEHYRTMRTDLIAAIDGLSDEQLSQPSLDGWSVKDHLAHIAHWDELRAGEVQRISAGYGSALQHLSEEQNEAYNAITRYMRQRLSPEQVHWELASTHQRLLEAITSATERALDGSRYTEAGLRGTHEAMHTAWIRRWRSEKRV